MSLFSIYYWCLIYAGKMRKIGGRNGGAGRWGAASADT